MVNVNGEKKLDSLSMDEYPVESKSMRVLFIITNCFLVSFGLALLIAMGIKLILK